MNQVYPIPIQFLKGNLADMAFYHVLFYMLSRRRPSHIAPWDDSENWSWRSEKADEHWRRVECTNEQFLSLTGLSPSGFNEFRNKLLQNGRDEIYTIHEEVGSDFVLHMPHYDTAVKRRVIQIPVQFIENNWLHLMCDKLAKGKSGRFRLAIINQFLRKPKGQRVLSLPEIRRRTNLDNQTLPERKKVLATLDDLIQFGLIHAVAGEKYQLNEAMFAQPAPQTTTTAVSHLSYPAIVQHALEENPALAELALECVEKGKFDIDENFDRIYRDLHYIDIELERGLLVDKVQRDENKIRSLPNDARWRAKWRGHKKALMRKSRSHAERSPKIPIPLDETGEQRVTLQIDHHGRLHNGFRLHYAKLVIWINDDYDMFFAEMGLQLTLEGDDGRLWEKAISLSDRLLRPDLTAMVQAGLASFVLSVQNEQPLWDATLSVQLEAYYLPR